MQFEKSGFLDVTAYFTPSEAKFLELCGMHEYPEIAAKADAARATFAALNPPDPLTQLEAIAEGTRTADIVGHLTDSVTAGNTGAPLKEYFVTSLERQVAERAAVDENGLELHVMGPVKLDCMDLMGILDLAIEHADKSVDHLQDDDTLNEAHNTVRQCLAEEGLSAAEIEQDIAAALEFDMQYQFDQAAIANGLIVALRPLFKD